VLDEFPTLEFAATAVALVLLLRAAILLGKTSSLVGGEARIESARARDLVGAAVLASAVIYAVRVDRASTWFLIASGTALLAHCLGFYLRARARKLARRAPNPELPVTLSDLGDEDELDSDEEDDVEDEPAVCVRCGSSDALEVTDTTRYLGGLSALGPLSAVVCRNCGALSGQLEEPLLLGVGPEHGTRLRSPSSESNMAQKPHEPGDLHQDLQARPKSGK
jgi:hypothetical protein